MTTSSIPAWATYIVDLGSDEYAAGLAEIGYGGRRIAYAGNGRIVLDDTAAASLRSQPEHYDGHIDEDMRMWVGGDPYPVVRLSAAAR
jgi:hypothetical protein